MGLFDWLSGTPHGACAPLPRAWQEALGVVKRLVVQEGEALEKFGIPVPAQVGSQIHELEVGPAPCRKEKVLTGPHFAYPPCLFIPYEESREAGSALQGKLWKGFFIVGDEEM